MILLDELAAAGGEGAIVLHPGPSSFPQVVSDSRNVTGGELFVALRGQGGDGHAHLEAAVRQGAAGLLVEREPDPGCPVVTGDGRPVAVLQVRDPLAALSRWAGRRLRAPGTEVVAVAGSLGKSTARALLEAALRGADPTRPWFSGGDRNDAVGLPIAVAAAPAAARAFLLEVQGGSLDEHRALAGLASPDVLAVTTTAEAGARYWRSQREAVRQLRLLTRRGTRAVVAADDPGLAEALGDRDPLLWSAAVRSGAAAPAPTTGPGVAVAVVGAPRRTGPGWRCVITVTGAGRWTATVPLAGPGGLRAVGCAVATVVALGLDPERGIEALGRVEPPPGRLRWVDAGGPDALAVLDDTVDATPAATVAALRELGTAPAPRVAILGECGHRPLGRADALRLADALLPLEGLVLHRPGGWAEPLLTALARRAPGLPVRRAETSRAAADAARELARSGGRRTGGRAAVLVKAIAARAPERVALALGAPAELLVRQDPGHRRRPFTSSRRPTWVAIDVDALAANVREVVAELGPATELMAVVKADAYGHGALQVARTAVAGGATWVATATVGEALDLRQRGLAAPCLVLGYTPPEQVEPAVRAGCTLTVVDVDVLRALDRCGARLGRPAQAHLEVDTGMSRLGVAPGAVAAFVIAARRCPGARLTGCYTHLRQGEDPVATTEQLRRLDAALAAAAAAGHRFELVHAASSAAWRSHPAARRQLVRVGIELLGLTTPDGRRRRPVLSWHTRVAQVRPIAAGTHVGYGTAFRAPSPMRIATIPVGFGDGFRRGPRTSGTVLVQGTEAPIVGDVCMDLTMVDVSHLQRIRVGEPVVLIGRQGALELSGERIAERLGTTTYELCAQILPRVPREVVDTGWPDRP